MANLGRAVDVERQNERTFSMAFRKVRHLVWVACRDHGPPAFCEHELGEFATEACRTTGAQPDGMVSIDHEKNSKVVGRR